MSPSPSWSSFHAGTTLPRPRRAGRPSPGAPGATGGGRTRGGSPRCPLPGTRAACDAPRSSGGKGRRRGFTLIETALATVILGVGVVAIVEAHESFMRSNNWSTHAATATFLGNELREMTRLYPRHDAVTGLALMPNEGGGNDLVGWGAEAGEVAVTDFDDVDDFEGIRFGVDGDLPGPIDAFGGVVPETLADGTVMLDPNGIPVPLQGWSQTVIVEKVLPTNFSSPVANDYRENPQQNAPWRDVDEFPLRVTVVVEYQGPFANQPEEITRVTWIVP